MFLGLFLTLGHLSLSFILIFLHSYLIVPVISTEFSDVVEIKFYCKLHLNIYITESVCVCASLSVCFFVPYARPQF